MQAYMKSAMPYHGVQAPALRRICRRLFAEHPLESAAAWRATVLLLWREAGHREERYAAVELAGDRRYRAHRTAIEPNLADRDFFIRKAIGWALRAHAWTGPDEVARYVHTNRARLSPLSRREALKNLGGAAAGR
jgi:3-methyladenine DNA glycosylase AlkD